MVSILCKVNVVKNEVFPLETFGLLLCPITTNLILKGRFIHVSPWKKCQKLCNPQSEKNVTNRKLQNQIQLMTLGFIFLLLYKTKGSVAKRTFWVKIKSSRLSYPPKI